MINNNNLFSSEENQEILLYNAMKTNISNIEHKEEPLLANQSALLTHKRSADVLVESESKGDLETSPTKKRKDVDPQLVNDSLQFKEQNPEASKSADEPFKLTPQGWRDLGKVLKLINPNYQKELKLKMEVDALLGNQIDINNCDVQVLCYAAQIFEETEKKKNLNDHSNN